uniref:Uncharacterized protein n=2 Tax=Caenorhabditis japonica TaxID=281687 RepID=A0A8R1IBJ6_CAEJA
MASIRSPCLLDQNFPKTKKQFFQNQDGIDNSPQTARGLYRDVLRDDGVLFLRLLDSNSGRLHAEELIKKIYHISAGHGSSPVTPVITLSDESGK